MIARIEMFLGVDGKQVGMKMTEYQMTANDIDNVALMTREKLITFSIR